MQITLVDQCPPSARRCYKPILQPMKMVLALTLSFLICALWLGMGALYFVALRRGGSGLEPATRLWLRLRVSEYGLLLVLVVSAVGGGPKLGFFTMGGS